MKAFPIGTSSVACFHQTYNTISTDTVIEQLILLRDLIEPETVIQKNLTQDRLRPTERLDRQRYRQKTRHDDWLSDEFISRVVPRGHLQSEVRQSQTQLYINTNNLMQCCAAYHNRWTLMYTHEGPSVVLHCHVAYCMWNLYNNKLWQPEHYNWHWVFAGALS